MEQIKNKPTGVKVDRNKGIIFITWNDEHESVYPFSLLRNACPCAECRGHANMSPTPNPEVFSMPEEKSPRTTVEDVEGVGSYALTIYWQDGHQYGIYNWNYLRALCPCDQCRA